jgi:hypothetical protein
LNGRSAEIDRLIKLRFEASFPVGGTPESHTPVSSWDRRSRKNQRHRRMPANPKETDLTEAVVLLDKDLAAKTIEPLVTLVLEQLASDAGLETLQGLLPIDVSVTITLRSGEQTLTTATMGSTVENFGAVS